jgi:sensor histidine kinase YesM
MAGTSPPSAGLVNSSAEDHSGGPFSQAGGIAMGLGLPRWHELQVTAARPPNEFLFSAIVISIILRAISFWGLVSISRLALSSSWQ